MYTVEEKKIVSIKLNKESKVTHAGYIYKERYYSLEEYCALKVRLSHSKRLIDLLISFGFLLFVGSWLFPIIALLIKLDSKGPVFFIQIRRGINDKVFKCIKFRTMYLDSRDVDKFGRYMQATSNDSRITKLGHFLRKTSIDELPQLLNILVGSMSLIGPRPHPEPLNIESQKILPYYWKRHLVKPGLSGLAQIKGFRGETQHDFQKMEKRVLLDLIYIRKWNIALDIKIILATIFRHPLGL